MDSEYIRKRTAIVIERDGMYLMAATEYHVPVWSMYIYDAWRTRSPEDASRVADAVDGNLWLFNSATGQKERIT